VLDIFLQWCYKCRFSYFLFETRNCVYVKWSHSLAPFYKLVPLYPVNSCSGLLDKNLNPRAFWLLCLECHQFSSFDFPSNIYYHRHYLTVCIKFIAFYNICVIFINSWITTRVFTQVCSCVIAQLKSQDHSSALHFDLRAYTHTLLLRSWSWITCQRHLKVQERHLFHITLRTMLIWVLLSTMLDRYCKVYDKLHKSSRKFHEDVMCRVDILTFRGLCPLK